MTFADRLQAPVPDVQLRSRTTLGIGGSARWFVSAETAGQVAAAHEWAGEHGIEVFVLGGGSNLVIADEGWSGLVLHVGVRGVEWMAAGADTLVKAGAGEPWDVVVANSVRRGLAGFECLSGIPGSVGGTPVQNVGAYGQDVAAVIEAVTVFDRRSATIAEIAGTDCGFAYRMSRFKGEDLGRFVVCRVTFRLRPGPGTVAYPDVAAYLERHAIMSAGPADIREAVLSIRRGKGMVLDPSDPDTRSVGSFFTNPIVDMEMYERIAASAGERVPRFPAGVDRVKIPAAWLIERAGFGRGYQSGPVGLSTKHPLAIVNRGGASARDVVELAVRIKRQVARQCHVWLRPEPVFVGFGDDAAVLFLTREDGH